MLTHEQIMKLRLVRFPAGEVVSLATEDKTGELVFAEASVHPQYYNLLRASAVLYKTLHYQGVAMAQLVKAAKAIGADGIIPSFDEMRGRIEFALTLAEQGVEAYVQQTRQ